AHGLAVDRDRVERLGLPRARHRHERARVVERVREGEAIAHLHRHAPVVRVARERGRVALGPGTDLAVLERNEHAPDHRSEAGSRDATRWDGRAALYLLSAFSSEKWCTGGVNPGGGVKRMPRNSVTPSSLPPGCASSKTIRARGAMPFLWP